MIERHDIQCVVMSGGAPASRALGAWLASNGLAWRYGSQDYGIDHARNQNVRRFLHDDVPLGKRYLLMIDNDMCPVPETLPILTEPGGLLYCGYVDRFGTPGHYGNGDFGAACFRASAECLAEMADPWFQTAYKSGRRVACECINFRRVAKFAGYRPAMVGVIGHEQRCILIPKDKQQYRIAWPPEFEE